MNLKGSSCSVKTKGLLNVTISLYNFRLLEINFQPDCSKHEAYSIMKMIVYASTNILLKDYCKK